MSLFIILAIAAVLFSRYFLLGEISIVRYKQVSMIRSSVPELLEEIDSYTIIRNYQYILLMQRYLQFVKIKQKELNHQIYG